ncbi:MAG: hypothetical protein R2798_06060 [Chitinophagales bacterium]
MELHKACATDGSYCEYFYLCYYELIDDSLKMKVSCHFTKPGMYAFRIFSQPQASHGELFDFTDDCYDFTTIYYNMNGTYNNNYYLLDNIPEEIKRSTLKGQFYEVGGFCFVVKE